MEFLIRIYLISALCCLCCIGERIFQEKKYGKEHDKELFDKDIRNSFTPGVNTYYVYLMLKETFK